MKIRLALFTAVALTAAPAIAQDANGPTLPVFEGDFRVGEELLSNEQKLQRLQGPQNEVANDQNVFVVEPGAVKPTGEWTAADRAACETSGGIELPISAGRTACFRL